MILFEGKLISYNDAAQKLKNFQKDRETADLELKEAEEKLDELEGEVHQLTHQINNLLEQLKADDLTKKLPTGLFMAGFKLTESSYAIEHKAPDLWAYANTITTKITVLEDREGNVIKKWNSNPSLADLFEVSIKV